MNTVPGGANDEFARIIGNFNFEHLQISLNTDLLITLLYAPKLALQYPSSEVAPQR